MRHEKTSDAHESARQKASIRAARRKSNRRFVRPENSYSSRNSDLRAYVKSSARYGGAFACNARLDAAATREFCVLASGADTLLQNAIDRLGFSARAYDKVLRVARALADLEETEKIEERHVGEAIQYRNLDRQVL